MYRVKRKNWEKTAPPITSPLTFEPASVRRRKIRSGAARDGAPDAKCKVALAPFAKDGGQDRECRRGEQRRTKPLQGAEGDQRAFRPGKAVQQRADGEERKPGDEQPPPPEQVGQPAAKEKCAAEEDRVGGDHPLQALLREVKVGPDRGQS